MFKKNMLILLALTSCNISYGFESNTNEPQEPIIILTQRLSDLDNREKECRTKKNEKILSGRNITTGGFLIGLSMFLASIFTQNEKNRDPLMGAGLWTCIGSLATGAFVGAYDVQELESIKTEKMFLAQQIKKLYKCPNVHAHNDPIKQKLSK